MDGYVMLGGIVVGRGPNVALTYAFSFVSC